MCENSYCIIFIKKSLYCEVLLLRPLFGEPCKDVKIASWSKWNDDIEMRYDQKLVIPGTCKNSLVLL